MAVLTELVRPCHLIYIGKSLHIMLAIGRKFLILILNQSAISPDDVGGPSYSCPTFGHPYKLHYKLNCFLS